MRFWRWIGHSGINAVIAEQFGTAMMPRWSRMRRPLISGITSGTCGSMRKAEELSMTTAPAATASGENLFEVALPAENSAISTPSKERSLSSSTVISCPRKASFFPADRAFASAFSLPTRKLRLSMVAMNSRPTAPVTPAMATTGSSLTFVSFGLDFKAIKKPRTFIRRGFGYGYAAVNLRAHDSRSPLGLSGFGRGFRDRVHGGGPYGPAGSASMAFAARFGS